MEILSRIYIKPADPLLLDRFQKEFLSGKGGKLSLFLSSFSRDKCRERIGEFFDEFEDDYYFPQSARQDIGYIILEYVLGSEGVDFVKSLLELLEQCIEIDDLRAWGKGDDDPWEFWIKLEDNCWVYKEDAPYDDKEQRILDIYSWWHIGLPETLREGVLSGL